MIYNINRDTQGDLNTVLKKFILILLITLIILRILRILSLFLYQVHLYINGKVSGVRPSLIISSMISPSEGRGIETRYVGADSEGGEETDTSPLTLCIMGGGDTRI